MHLLGTKRGTQPYQNPEKIGAVTTLASSESTKQEKGGLLNKLAARLGSYKPHRLVQNGCDGKNNHTRDKPGSWVLVDLHDAQIEVEYYCLRHGFNDGGVRLRSWELQGSADGEEWATLRSHADDEALANAAFSTAGWAVKRGQGAFSMFRVLMTGPNSSGTHFLCCAGIELYGTVWVESGAGLE
jgi:hypothetical protein